MIPLDKVRKIIDIYETLEKELASSNIEKRDFVKKSKEYSTIGEVIHKARGYVSFQKEKREFYDLEGLWGDAKKIELNALDYMFKKAKASLNDVAFNKLNDLYDEVR